LWRARGLFDTVAPAESIKVQDFAFFVVDGCAKLWDYFSKWTPYYVQNRMKRAWRMKKRKAESSPRRGGGRSSRFLGARGAKYRQFSARRSNLVKDSRA
jgi:hypothetical protein